MRVGSVDPALALRATTGTPGIESGSPVGTDGASGPVGLEAPTKSVFEAAMENAVLDAAQRSHTADAKVQALAAGTSDDLHGTLISAKEAEISLKLVNTVRTKMVDAFHELWRTNV